MDTPDEIKENCTVNLLSYAHLSCVIFDNMHFCIVSENTWDVFFVKFLEAMHFRGMHFLVFLFEENVLFWDMQFSLEICTFKVQLWAVQTWAVQYFLGHLYK